MGKALLVLIAALPLASGCASSLGTVMNRPVVENSIKDLVSTVSLSAERRNVVVVTAPGKNQGKYCAEPPPDAAKELATQLRAAAEVQAQVQAQGQPIIARGSLDDLYREQMHILATRTPALEAFRIGLYALCQMYVIEALTQAEVNFYIGKLIDNYPWSASPPPLPPRPSASGTPSPQGAGPSAPANPAAPSAPAKPQSPARPGEVAPVGAPGK